MTAEKTVVVVGCGLAGLAVSICLSQKGFEVHIVERKQDFESQGATFGLAPNGQKALDQFCPQVLEYLKSIGIPLSTGGYMLPWWKVRDSLLERAQNEPDITIHMGLKLDSIQETSNKVIASFSNSDLTLEGSVLVGADGVHSQVRSILGAKPAIPTGASVWRGQLNLTGIPNLSYLLTSIDTWKFYMLGPTAVYLFNFHTKLPGIVAWVVSSKANNIQNGTTTPLDLITDYSHEDKDVITEIFQKSDEIDLKWSTEMSVVELSDGWGGKGRVTLIGDAAHALRPSSGLGGSLAFEDAVILSNMLDTSNDAAIETLGEFENKRLPRCKVISDDQTKRAEVVYQGNVEVPPWSDEFIEWLSMGPEAPSNPPDKMYRES